MQNLLYTLDGEAVINLTSKTGTREIFDSGYYKADATLFYIDLTDPSVRIRLIKSYEDAGDCPFFHQLKKVCEKRSIAASDKCDDSFLSDKILIVDFENTFIGRNKTGYTTKQTFAENGLPGFGYDEYTADYIPDQNELVRDFFINSKIIIRFPKHGASLGDAEERRFTVFDKSQSMARNSKILLIDEQFLSDTCLHRDLTDDPLTISLIDMGLEKKLIKDEENNKEKIVCFKDLDLSERKKIIAQKISKMHLADHDSFHNERLTLVSSEDYFVDSLYQYINTATVPERSLNLSDDIIKVIFPEKIEEYTDENNKYPFSDTDVRNSEDIIGPDGDVPSYSAFHCLILNKDSDHFYYIRKDLWDNVEGKNDEEKLSTLKRNYDSYQQTVLDRRLNLGIDFHGAVTGMSKFYAYRGLYLSTSERIEDKELILDEKKIIVIPDIPDDDLLKKTDEYKDVYDYKHKTSVITNKDVLDEDGCVCIETFNDKELCNSPMFDGEGIISREYADILKKHKEGEIRPYEDSNSFQIRMPFIKGVLHYVDFKSFYKKILEQDDLKNGLWITDCFGKKRNILEADIILTESMFKAAKWLKTLEKSVTGNDPMKFYFQKVREYDHSLYISGSDAYYLHGNLTSLNYQLLNTLDLSEDELKSILETHFEYIEHPENYITKTSDIKEDDDNQEPKQVPEDDLSDDGRSDDADPENPSDELPDQDRTSEKATDEETEKNKNGFETEDDEKTLNNSVHPYVYRDKWIDVLRLEPKFKDHPYIKKKLESMSQNMIRDIAFGRIITYGEIRYLSRDLMLLLEYILILSYLSDGNEKKKNVIQTVENELLKGDSFYAPSRNKKDSRTGWFPLFRNPHLSKNEQCAMECFNPDPESLRSEYLGHLTGVLMVSNQSFAPKTLGGADFDGDIVKIFYDDSIKNAVLRSAYKEMKAGETSDRETRGKYARTLPIIDITPLKKVSDEKGGQNASHNNYSDKTDYKTLYDTFANQVGAISNLAINKGQKTLMRKNGNNSDCARYTILTGLEIDACKTGIHPSLKDSEKTTGDVKKAEEKDTYDNGYYSFLYSFLNPLKANSKKNNNIRKLPEKYIKETKILSKEENGEEITMITYKRTGERKVSAPDFENTEKDSCYTALNYVAYVFMYICKYNALPWNERKILSKTVSKSSYALRVLPMEGKTKDKEKKNDEINEKLREVLGTYYDAASNLRTVRGLRQKRDTSIKCVYSILKRKNLNDIEMIKYTEETKKTLSSLILSTKNNKEADDLFNAAIERISDTDCEWPYLSSEKDKIAAFKKILGVKKDLSDAGSLGMIFDHRNYGYNLLYLFLKILSEESRQLTLINKIQEEFLKDDKSSADPTGSMLFSHICNKVDEIKNSYESSYKYLFKEIYDIAYGKGHSTEANKKAANAAEYVLWRYFSAKLIRDSIDISEKEVKTEEENNVERNT